MPDGYEQISSKWMDGHGPDGEIVLSSRVRLARNINNMSFPYLAPDSQTEEVQKQVKSIYEQKNRDFADFAFFQVKDVLPLQRQVLIEKHLISPLLVREPHNSAVLMRQDEAVIIMINEEDHLRIQCLLPGLQLEQALQEAMSYDDLLERELDYAFDENWGYLTVCPTNVGTGLRASVMVHLPALVLTKQINRVLAAIAQVGLAVRGLYGEGSEMVGNLVQISNQITLGQSEVEIVRNLYSVTKQVIEQEFQARQLLLNEGRERLADRVNRALGILRYARVLSSQEAMQLLSDVRLGIDSGLIDEVDGSVMKELMVMLQPACLQVWTGKELDGLERDMERARLINKRLGAGKV
ncbi:MAG: protein arginine kinase [Dethiobacter sp.]|jgi:protein arginine kinase|nr:protein arginine kinase [Dethiobacter sp.]